MAETSQWHISWSISVGAFILAAAVEVGSAVWPDKIKPHPHIFISFAVLGVFFVVARPTKALWAHLRSRMGPEEPLSPLEIIFEPLNPARRFWSLENHTDKLGRRYPPYWEYRVEVRNNSGKTLRNVMVSVERTGPLPELPYVPPFKRTKQDKCDINPGCSELIQVLTWPHPKRRAGMLAGDSAWGYGPIRVTASADDTLSVVRVFNFNYDTDQMLFDVENY